MSASSSHPIRTVEDLLAYALAMETEAAERYEELADQMEVHHNQEVAQLFRKMAAIEGRHSDHMQELARGMELPEIAPWDYQWPGAESPEAIDPQDLHYRIPPARAIALALRHERRAAAFYRQLAQDAQRDDVRRTAEEFAVEEEEHVRWLEQWLTRYPPAEPGWEEDPDPPNQPD